MLKKTIKYVDYDGKERSEDFYFNLSKAELIEMDLVEQNGLEATINKIIDAKDNKRIVEMFKDLILRSYGEKSVDGRRFIKSKELSEQFSQTEAFVELYMSMFTNPDEAAAFIKAVGPQIPEQDPAKHPAVK